MEKYRIVHDMIIERMEKIGIPLMRVSIGIIFFWFGALKFFDGLSPAQTLAIETIDLMTFGIFTEKVIIYGLATWEVLIGIGMLFNLYIKQTIILLILQMAGTFMPVFLFPGEVFNVFPYSLTLEGQYIIKNLVVISGAIIIGGKLPKKMVKTEQQ